MTAEYPQAKHLLYRTQTQFHMMDKCENCEADTSDSDKRKPDIYNSLPYLLAQFLNIDEVAWPIMPSIADNVTAVIHLSSVERRLRLKMQRDQAGEGFSRHVSLVSIQGRTTQ